MSNYSETDLKRDLDALKNNIDELLVLLRRVDRNNESFKQNVTRSFDSGEFKK